MTRTIVIGDYANAVGGVLTLRWGLSAERPS